MARKTKPTACYDEVEIMRRVAEVSAGLTLREQQQRFGVSHESIRRYHRGMNSPSLSFIARVCLETGVSAEWMLFGTGARFSPERGQARKRSLQQR